MDRLSIVNFSLAAVANTGGQLLDGASVDSLAQLAALLIVIGGTLGDIMVRSSPPTPWTSSPS